MKIGIVLYIPLMDYSKMIELNYWHWQNDKSPELIVRGFIWHQFNF